MMWFIAGEDIEAGSALVLREDGMIYMATRLDAELSGEKTWVQPTIH